MTLYAAIVGVIGGLLATTFAGWQAYLLRRQLVREDQVNRAVFYQSVTQAFSDLNRVFIESPDLRPYFYENVRLAPGDDRSHNQLMAIAGLIADTAESCIAAEDVLLPHLKGDWDDHFNFIYRNSPVLREWWGSMGHLYPEQVKRAILGPSLRPKDWPSSLPEYADSDTAQPRQSLRLSKSSKGASENLKRLTKVQVGRQVIKEAMIRTQQRVLEEAGRARR